MARRTGITATRSLVGGWAANQIGDDIERGRTMGQAPTLQRAVVVDVIMDPNLLTNQQVENIANTVNNPRFASVMPTNSVVARIVSDAGGQTARTNTILFPFFSSHFQLPVQPGEIVEVIYDDYSNGGQQLGYWVTRTSTQRTVEDANYTHFDRTYQPFNNPAAFTSEQRQNRSNTQPPPGFPNGGDTIDTVTLNQSSSSENTFDLILKRATSGFGNFDDNNNEPESIPIITPEPVPRWRKRPQEFVLQGANNTLIVLGEDRKGGPLGARAEEGPDAKGQAGTIDMVVGRGRVLPEDNRDPNESFGGNTAPWVTANTREARETDKTHFLKVPGSSRLNDNPTEGDPDYVRDAARLYVTMQSEVDTNFGLTEIEYTTDTLPTGDSKNELNQPRSGEAGTFNKSYIVGKADHLRLIARKDETNGVEGTVLIVREGTSEQDLCYLYVSKEGVHIEGPKIILGRGLHDEPDAEAPGGEPYIRWSKFKETVDSLHDEMETMRTEYMSTFDNLQTTINQLLVALQASTAASICVPFAPDPAFTILAPPVGTLLGKLPAVVAAPRGVANGNLPPQTTTTNEAVEAARSSKIFGE